MSIWLDPAIKYISSWLDFQMRLAEQPGCIFAMRHQGSLVIDKAWGYSNLTTQEKLTPRHLFRVSSHSKSFTAAGIMKLCENGKLDLDDPIGKYVKNLNSKIASIPIVDILSHAGGIVRDGQDGDFFLDRRSFLNTQELVSDLQLPPILSSMKSFKYSNHGFALLGLLIEVLTGEPYNSWIQKNIVNKVGLNETTPDISPSAKNPFTSGHTTKYPIGRRLIIPGKNSAQALSPAAGFVSTAHDLTLFFDQLRLDSKDSLLSLESRKAILQRRSKMPGEDRHYGLGVMIGGTGNWSWFGHTGSFQGYSSRTICLPDHQLTLSLLTNSLDKNAVSWVEGIIQILRIFKENFESPSEHRSWSGRWWNIWRAVDFVPMTKKILVADPSLLNPFADSAEIVPFTADKGNIVKAENLGCQGETASIVRNDSGEVVGIWFGGKKLVSENELSKEMRERYEK